MLPQYRGRTSDSLGWAPPPDGFALRQVLYVLRHGERAPVRTRLETASPPIVEPWNMCHTSHEFDKAVLRFSEKGENEGVPARVSIQRRIELAPLGSQARPGNPGDCLLGELTDLGRMTMLKIGMALRRVYVDHAHFLPEEYLSGHAPFLYLRSTNVPRTMQSLDEVITGLYPPTDRVDTLTPVVYVRNAGQEDMTPGSRPCPRLDAMLAKFADQAASLYNPALAQFDKHIAPHNNGQGPRVDGRPRLSGLIDTARSAIAHGVPAPIPFLDEEIMDQMETAVIHEWFAGYQAKDPIERTQYRRLAMGELLSSLYGRFDQSIQNPQQPIRLSILCGHDSTLVGILQCLDCFNGKWPDFGAAIGWELFEDKKKESKDRSSDHHYVRCRYGDEVLHIPGCAAEDRHYPGHPELCTLTAFREVVVDRLRHPDGASLEEECQFQSPTS
ncbi:acid phosphatase [Malassezia psittaci]|uniref:Acid phosphatase n=1 Tax=Malassezia psittaci TaxID=1821823 RepID=A0AAF0JDG2_9BASI|nr:acid phosphatase [Malassezia psittaci]